MDSEVREDRRLNQLFADPADSLVRENFSGVEAEWWWERRPDGGVSICQEMDPETLTREMALVFDLNEDEVRRRAVRALGLDSFDPVVLVYELPGDTPEIRAAEALAERSSTSAGLAAGIYHELAEAIRESVTPREDG